jgi:hypothetical protein
MVMQPWALIMIGLLAWLDALAPGTMMEAVPAATDPTTVAR